MRRLRLLSLDMESEQEAEDEVERERRAVGSVLDSPFCVGFPGTHGREFGGSVRLLQRSSCFAEILFKTFPYILGDLMALQSRIL